MLPRFRFEVCSITFYDLKGTQPVLKYQRMFCFVNLWIATPTHSIRAMHLLYAACESEKVILYDGCFIVGTGPGRLVEDCSHNLNVKMG